MKTVDEVLTWLNAVVKTKIGVRNFILKKAAMMPAPQIVH